MRPCPPLISHSNPDGSRCRLRSLKKKNNSEHFDRWARSIANITSPLLSLPPELLDLINITTSLPRRPPLKHTSLHLYPLIDTSVQLKVSWLVSRHGRGLERPRRNCILKTDAAICASGGGEVRMIMERRRSHWECDRAKGCEVVEGAKCQSGGGRGKRSGTTIWWWRGRRKGGRKGWGADLVGLLFRLGRDKRWEWVGGFLGIGLLGFFLALMVELLQWLCVDPVQAVEGTLGKRVLSSTFLALALS